MNIKQIQKDLYYIGHKKDEDLIIINTKEKTISIKPNNEYKIFI
jgi:hypothetical protein